ncbi:DUF4062 domain-containing protein [Aquimarina sp. 2201CG1-2-11]|uniref:DUF4062 domain-containing protein n=1 Tax=Aquimarina discodermiae TaxID=3231043 RepID=UPI003461B9D6
MIQKRNGIKILVASTVYGFEDQLSAIYTQLDNYGYDVINSHMGTVYAGAENSNLQNCMDAVDECDVFLGLIRPHYGSGVIGETSITHEEVLRAILLKKARWFLVDSKVVFARQLLRKAEIVEKNSGKKIKLEDVIIRPNTIIDVRSIEIYNAVTKDKVPPKERKGHWAQEYYDLPGMTRYIEGQFSDSSKVKRTIDYMNSL